MTRDGMRDMGKYCLIYSILCGLCFFFDILPLVTELGGEDVAVDGYPIGFHRADGSLLPGAFEGLPAAANRVGDVFDLDSILKMAHASLDEFAGDAAEAEGTRRKNGMVLVIKIEYTNTHESSWLGLRITPFSDPPQPTYTYRMFVTAAASYRITKTYNDPADAKRIIRVYNGIRIVLEQGGKIASWSVAQFLVTFTSALGLLAVSTTLTEMAMLNFMSRKEFYQKKKFAKTRDLNADDGDEEQREHAAEMHKAVESLMDGLDTSDKQQVYKALSELVHDMSGQQGGK